MEQTNSPSVVYRVQQRSLLIVGFGLGLFIFWYMSGQNGEYSGICFLIGVIAFIWWSKQKQTPKKLDVIDAVRGVVAQFNRLGRPLDFDIENLTFWSPPGTQDLWWICFSAEHISVLTGFEKGQLKIFDKSDRSLASIQAEWFRREGDLARSKINLEEIVSTA